MEVKRLQVRRAMGTQDDVGVDDGLGSVQESEFRIVTIDGGIDHPKAGDAE
jgi:hypothetical protein